MLAQCAEFDAWEGANHFVSYQLGPTPDSMFFFRATA